MNGVSSQLSIHNCKICRSCFVIFLQFILKCKCIPSLCKWNYITMSFTFRMLNVSFKAKIWESYTSMIHDISDFFQKIAISSVPCYKTKSRIFCAKVELFSFYGLPKNIMLCENCL